MQVIVDELLMNMRNIYTICWRTNHLTVQHK